MIQDVLKPVLSTLDVGDLVHEQIDYSMECDQLTQWLGHRKSSFQAVRRVPDLSFDLHEFRLPKKTRGYTNLVFKRKTWGFNRFQYSPSLNLGVILSIFRQTQLFFVCKVKDSGRLMAFAPRGAPPHVDSLWSPGSILPKWATGPPGDYKGLWKYQLTQMPSVRFASDKAWALCLKCCGSALSRQKLWETLVFSTELWVVSDILSDDNVMPRGLALKTNQMVFVE